MISHALTWDDGSSPIWHTAAFLLRPLHWALAFPSFIYLSALTIFLFRPPDIRLFYADRVAFAGLVLVVLLRCLALRDWPPLFMRFTLPMLVLTGFAVFRVFREPYDPLAWSLVASKFIVPFTLFHLAAVTFRSSSSRAHFRIFVLLVLAYLAFIAIAFLADARELIFPKFILDDNLGIHVHRARGPFLQAVANGVSLNILGLLSVAFAQKWKKVVLLLWLVLPLAILATMTRAVWIAFAVSAVAVAFRLGDRRLRRATAGIAVAAAIAIAGSAFVSDSLANSIQDRAEERAPVDFRVAVYDAGWEMFQERPLTGWTSGRMSAELARRMDGYRLRTYYIHNTYLSLLIEFGLPGLVLYGILFCNLFRLRRSIQNRESDDLPTLRRIWPILLGVYLFNAFFVDLVYQFVTGLLFTVAGMLCAPEVEVAS